MLYMMNEKQLQKAIAKGLLKQRGVITFGNELDRKAWIASARAEGYLVRIRNNGYAELYA